MVATEAVTPTEAESNNAASVPIDVSDMDLETQLAHERARADKLKRQLNLSTERCFELEAEMADFSSYLLDEANEKVAAANRLSAEASRRVAGLMRQIQERDVLVEAQQQQLDFLKMMIAEQDESEPPSPSGMSQSALGSRTDGFKVRNEQAGDAAITVNAGEPASLALALKIAQWSSIVRPVCRRDTIEYAEFLQMLPREGAVATVLSTEARQASKLVNSSASVTAATGKSTTTPGAGASMISSPKSVIASPSTARNLMTGSSVVGAGPTNGAETSDSNDGEEAYSWKAALRLRSTDHSTSSNAPRKPLLSHKFVQRTTTEDVEPALRLEQAPHLSWLVRRAWQAAVLDGTLAIEPVPAAEKRWAFRPSYPCVMCGQAREEAPYGRLHVVKVPRDTHLYAVGDECVMRLRFACDYIGFLRTLYNGMRKLETSAQITAAWEECIRLREQLFWARTGAFYMSMLGSETPGLWTSSPSGSLGQDSQNNTAPTTPVTPSDRVLGSLGNDGLAELTTGTAVSVEAMVQSTIVEVDQTKHVDQRRANSSLSSPVEVLDNDQNNGQNNGQGNSQGNSSEPHNNPTDPGNDPGLGAQLDELDDAHIENVQGVSNKVHSPGQRSMTAARAGSPAVIDVQSAVKVLASAVTTISVENQDTDVNEVE